MSDDEQVADPDSASTVVESEMVEMAVLLEQHDRFRGPDPEIMGDHTLEPRSAAEDEALAAIEGLDVDRMVVQNKLQSIVNEAKEVVRQIAYSPGAKYNDLITALFTKNGDLAVASSTGVVIFSVLQSYPIKYILKKAETREDYEINPGDIFYYNDAQYGITHSADQGTFLPIFNDDETLIGWAGCTVHEGENGATEPGGMPSDAESRYDEGLKVPPMKIGSNFELNRELITFFQNSVRDKTLMKHDHRARLVATRRIRDRVRSVGDDFEDEFVIGVLRHLLESTEQEVRNRIQAIPNGEYRHTLFIDSTLKDDCLIKIPLCLSIHDDYISLDFEGVAPEFGDRTINSVLASLKGGSAAILNYVWPDLPRNQAVFEPIRYEVSDNTILNCSIETPTAQTPSSFVPAYSAIDAAMMKAGYTDFVQENDANLTDVHANQHTGFNAWSFGGITQHGDFQGNLLTDINVNPGGARWNRDGLDSHCSTYAAMGDMGEVEDYEDRYPFVGLTRNKILKDLQGFGKYRGGQGHQQVFTHKDTPNWNWLVTDTGSRFPCVSGLFGGYGGPTVPCGRVKDINVFEEMADDDRNILYDIPDIMNEQPYDGEYSTWDLGLQEEEADEGEIYWLSQGAGGGLGDPLDREPEAVLSDLQDGSISEYVAESIYQVQYDLDTDTVDEERTQENRAAERERRLERGVPFEEFTAEWTTESPPEDVPYFGSWSDSSVVYAGTPERQVDVDELSPVKMNRFRAEHPELFDTPIYPPKPMYQGDLD